MHWQTEEILARAKKTQEMLDRMNEVLALQHAAEATNRTIMFNPMDELLLRLQLLASTIIVGEIKDTAVRPALMAFAKKFEELDNAMCGGLQLPKEWAEKR